MLAYSGYRSKAGCKNKTQFLFMQASNVIFE
jgi:hypothetical protein